MTSVQRARRPLSYAGASDRGPCEGWQASPSNPTGAGKARAKEPLTETFVFRCTAAEKAELRAKAYYAALSLEGDAKGKWGYEEVEQAKRRADW